MVKKTSAGVAYPLQTGLPSGKSKKRFQCAVVSAQLPCISRFSDDEGGAVPVPLSEHSAHDYLKDSRWGLPRKTTAESSGRTKTRSGPPEAESSAAVRESTVSGEMCVGG